MNCTLKGGRFFGKVFSRTIFLSNKYNLEIFHRERERERGGTSGVEKRIGNQPLPGLLITLSIFYFISKCNCIKKAKKTHLKAYTMYTRLKGEK